jgi:hypothetical protein
MTADQRRPDRNGSDDEVIRPVGYRPVELAPGRRVPLNPLQIGLLAALLVVGSALWFLFTAESVRIATDPPAADVSLSGGLRLRLGDVWLLRPGVFGVNATAPGHHPLETEFEVLRSANQVHLFTLTRLPGAVSFESQPPGASVSIDGATLGVTPTGPHAVPAGPVSVTYAQAAISPCRSTSRSKAWSKRRRFAANWCRTGPTSASAARRPAPRSSSTTSLPAR